MKGVLFIALLFLSTLSFSQSRFKQFVVSAGVSHSFLRGVHKIPHRQYENSFDFKPGVYGSFDWGLFNFLSFGGSFAYQKHTLSINDYQYLNGNGNVIVEDVRYAIQATGFQIRGLVHTPNYDDYFDLYGGVQYTYMFWNYRNTSSDPDFNDGTESLNKIPGLVGGIRWYPIEQFALFAELAFPGPYTITMGVCFRNDPKPFTWGFPFRFLN